MILKCPRCWHPNERNLVWGVDREIICSGCGEKLLVVFPKEKDGEVKVYLVGKKEKGNE